MQAQDRPESRFRAESQVGTGQPEESGQPRQAAGQASGTRYPESHKEGDAPGHPPGNC